MSEVIFGYWKFRGLGQYLRLLLAYTGIPFREVQYDSEQKWFKEDKNNLGFDFPNLPYIIDEDFKLTESAAIAKYIINRSGKVELLGKNTQDQGKVNSIIGVFNDALKDIRGLFMDKDHEMHKVQLLEKARPKFDEIKRFIGDNIFALGYLTLVDFILAQNLAYFEALYPLEYKNYGFWWRIRLQFEKLPEIKAYYQRPDAVYEPYLPPKLPFAPSKKKVKLAYWKIRGQAQTIRLLLSYCGVDFEDYVYSEGDKWFNEDKLNLGLDFPCLPYLIDGHYNIIESGDILRYVVKKWGRADLIGKDIKDNAEIECLLSIFNEISGSVKGLFFNKDYQIVKVKLLQKYQQKLQLLNKFIGEKSYALGYLTLLDFVIAEDSNYFQALFPQISKTYPFLKRIRQNFNDLPQIKEYYQRDSSFKGLFLPTKAILSVQSK